MPKKTASVISIVSLSLFVLISFMPVIYEDQWYRTQTAWRAIFTKISSKNVNMFHWYKSLPIIIVAIAVIGIIALILQMYEKRSFFVTLGIWSSAITLLLFVLLTYLYLTLDTRWDKSFSSLGFAGYPRYVLCWGFYIECALLIVSSVLSFQLTTGKGIITEKANGADSFSNVNTLNETDEVDLLKKYKDLLDSGAITEQEYEEKKKRLLKL